MRRTLPAGTPNIRLNARQNADSDYIDYARVDLLGLGGEPFENASLKMGRKDSYKLSFTHTKQRYVYDMFDVTNDVDGNSWNTDNRRTGLDRVTASQRDDPVFLTQLADQLTAEDSGGPGDDHPRLGHVSPFHSQL